MNKDPEIKEELLRSFKGVWIPKELWLDRNITLIEKCLFIEIESLDNEFGCIASNSYFSKFFNLSPSRISEIISDMVKKGMLLILNKKTLELLGWKTHRVIKINKNYTDKLYLHLENRSDPSENRRQSSESQNDHSEKPEYNKLPSSLSNNINTKPKKKFTEDIRREATKVYDHIVSIEKSIPSKQYISICQAIYDYKITAEEYINIWEYARTDKYSAGQIVPNKFHYNFIALRNKMNMNNLNKQKQETKPDPSTYIKPEWLETAVPFFLKGKKNETN